MDRPGVRQVPEGSGEQGKMEKTGCKIICGATTTLAVKGLMTMMTNEDTDQNCYRLVLTEDNQNYFRLVLLKTDQSCCRLVLTEDTNQNCSRLVLTEDTN